MLFYDFEVFMYDWMVVCIDMDSQHETDIINDPDLLLEYYQKHVNDIWIGFNSSRYDIYILQGILCGFNPKKINDWIIKQDKPGWKFSGLLKKFPLLNYDIMQRKDRGLKWFEGSMGNNIKETDVPFDINRKLTKEELDQTLYYCRHDVEQTIEVFIERKNDFEAQLALIKMFNMPLSMITKTKTQLSAEILGASYHTYSDEWNVSLPETLDVHKYKYVPEWFMNEENHHYKDGKKSHILSTTMAGIEMRFGWGGVHGDIKHYHSKGYFLNMDVNSLYPNIMLHYPDFCMSRSIPKSGIERYQEILDVRLKLKHEGKKKEQAPLKIVLNATYGAYGNKTSKMYDPLARNNVCIFGMTLVGVDLFEKLEPYAEMIQANTDGILIRKPDRYTDVDAWYQKIDDIAYEWESRTGLKLDFDDYGWGEIYQKDVNNYIIIDGYDGHYKAKGGFVKDMSRLDYDLPIVNKALVNAMVNKIPVEQTINSCNDLKEFQMIRKISKKYTSILYGNKVLNEQCARIFASKDWINDPGVTKIKADTGNAEKMEGTPEHCFIWNDDVNVKCPEKLDKGFYIDLAKKRLEGFGA